MVDSKEREDLEEDSRRVAREAALQEEDSEAMPEEEEVLQEVDTMTELEAIKAFSKH